MISIITILFIAFSSNNIIINSTNTSQADNNNTFTISCNISIIACLNDIPHPEKKEDHKIQADLILEQVSSTKL